MKHLRWIIIPLLLFTMGCLGRFARPELPRPHFERHWQETEKVTPVIVKTEDSEIIVVEARERTLVASVEKMPPPPVRRPLIQRFFLWLGGLSIVYLIILVVAGPGVVVAIIVWKIRTARRLGNAIREIVKGVQRSGVVRENTKLHDELKFCTSRQTKKIIGDIKASL